MALTPQQIQEMNNIARGVTSKSAPAVQPTPQKSGGFLADEAGDWGITSAAKSLTRNVLSAPVSAAKTMLKVPINLAQKTTQLTADFASKYLGEDNPFVQGIRDSEKNIDYNKKLALDTGTLGKTSENFGGKSGKFVGNIIPYFAGGAAKLPARIALDTAIATGQTGSITEGAKTGLVSAATGLVGPLVREGGKLLSSVRKTSNVVKPMTATKAAMNYGSSVLKGASQGYVGDVATGLAGQKGEENTGAGAFKPGLGTVLGSVVGGVQGKAKLRQDINKITVQNTRNNMDNLIGTITQGKVDDIPKVKNALLQFTPDELKSVKTYKDYEKVLDTKIASIEEAADKALEKSPVIKKLADLDTVETVTTVNGVERIPNNYVAQGLTQLDDYYTSINNVTKKAQIQAYIKKANTTGLTVTDIRNIAKLHGQDLNAFNANNQLSSGLAKQTAENTRAGITKTYGEQFGNPKLMQEKNKIVSELMTARTFANNMIEKVNKFEQTIMEKGVISRTFNRVAQYVPYGIRFAFTKALSGLIGNDTARMTPKDLENKLNKTLVNLKQVLDSGKSENEMMRIMEDIANKTYISLPNGEKLKREIEQMRRDNVLKLPEPTSNFQGKPIPLTRDAQSTVSAREKSVQKNSPLLKKKK